MSIARIGDAPSRREDRRLLTGQGRYIDDIPFPGAAHAVFLRSPHTHARISAVEVTKARAAPGVLAVLTAKEVAADGLLPLPPTVEVNVRSGERFAFMSQPLLADGYVRHVGEAVALVVADTEARARDAAELIEVSYEPLAAVVSMSDALAPGVIQISPQVPRNTCLDWRTGDKAAVDAAFSEAAHIVRQNISNHRVVTSSIETRGMVGSYDAASQRYTLHVSGQSIFVCRDFTAKMLGVPAEKVRFVAPDIGGAFGTRNFAYVDYPLLLWAAKRVGRPVKWIGSRSESFVSDHHARDQEAEAALALDADGRFLGLRVESVANAGAYLRSQAAVQTYQYVHLSGSVYRIPAIDLRIRVVLTNTPPVGVTRGPGFAEAVNIMERLIDKAARTCGFDRAALRRLNMVPAAAMPMTNVLGEKVDSGAFPEALDRALDKADVAGFAARRAETEKEGRLRGLGLAYHIKGTGGFPQENAEVRFEADGTVSLLVGTHAVGQGHGTTFPQIVADRLGIPNALIRHRQADTDLLPMGGGSGSSRSTYMAGTVIWRACEEIVSKGRKLAAGMLEAAEDDLTFVNGRFVVKGTDRSVSLLAIAEHARQAGEQLKSYQRFTREWMTFPNGAHVVEVEVDPDTGFVKLDRYTAVDDYGVIIHPGIVTGQVHGAIVQGIGQAILEHTAFDAASGQQLSASFMDYAMPRAADIPHLALFFNNTPCATNPLGVKGCGESGAVAAYPAIANAIDDALAPLGAQPIDGPATPERVWRLIEAARRSRQR